LACRVIEHWGELDPTDVAGNKAGSVILMQQSRGVPLTGKSYCCKLFGVSQCNETLEAIPERIDLIRQHVFRRCHKKEVGESECGESWLARTSPGNTKVGSFYHRQYRLAIVAFHANCGPMPPFGAVAALMTSTARRK
jgi:hypothetical protein